MSRDMVAVVTGASRGIGRAIAIRLASMGFKVAINYRKREEEAEKTLKAVREAGGEGVTVKADVSNASDVEAMFNFVENKLGEPLVLVNNAGWGLATPLTSVDERLWDRTINVNLKSVYLCTRRALPAMLEAKWGRIVNITSVAGLYGLASLVPYSAAKAGVIGFTRALALELKESGVTVNAIAAGLVRTRMGVSLVELMGITVEEWAKRHTLTGRVVEPEEVAELVAYLISESARNITGQVFVIDSGQSLVEFSRQP